jgi:hypothetical protein
MRQVLRNARDARDNRPAPAKVIDRLLKANDRLRSALLALYDRGNVHDNLAMKKARRALRKAGCDV